MSYHIHINIQDDNTNTVYFSNQIGTNLTITQCMILISAMFNKTIHLWVGDTIKMIVKSGKKYTLTDYDDLYLNCKMNPSDFGDDKDSKLAKKIINKFKLKFDKMDDYY